jgi:hypothetical protein
MGLAFWASQVIAWRKQGTEVPLELLWKRVAYATRYGRASLTEALQLDEWALIQFCQAVSEIVRDENHSPGSLQNRT